MPKSHVARLREQTFTESTQFLNDSFTILRYDLLIVAVLTKLTIALDKNSSTGKESR